MCQHLSDLRKERLAGMSDGIPKIRLRELDHSDLTQLNAWRNDKEIIEHLGNNFLFISGAVDEDWFQSYLRDREHAIRLAIITEDAGEYIGNVNLTSIHRINRSAEFSILIGEKRYWSRGVGAQATRLMLDHAFRDLNLNRIYLTVVRENTRALRLYKRMGFSEEGCLREAIFKDGSYRDLVAMSVLKSEFLRMK
jgi:diamine N-acetyltransferase